MIELLLRTLLAVTLGLALVLLLRRCARRVFGAGPAFTLWLLPVVLALAPLLPQQFAPADMVVLPGFMVTPHAVAGATSRAAMIDWAQWLVVLWLLGAAVGWVRLGIQYFRLLRGLRAAPTTWTRALKQALPGIDVRRVRVHDAGPAVLWGLPRSLILLPEDFAERFGDATRELVLRHELTHARRHDPLWSLAMEIASTLLWFHPLAWLSRPRFRLDQELACDAESLRAVPERTAGYARALIGSVAAHPAPALIPWLSEPQLKERIAMITRIPPGALRRSAGFVAIAMLLAGGLYVAGGQNVVWAVAPAAPGVTPPSVDVTYKQEHPPRYPIEALRKGEQGVVALDVTVDASGKVTNIEVDPKGTTAAAILQKAAIQGAQNWKFDPGKKDGHPAGGVVRIPVTFSLMSWKSTGPHPCPPTYHYQDGSFDGKAYKCTAEGPATPSSVLVNTH